MAIELPDGRCESNDVLESLLKNPVEIGLYEKRA
jgi:hypothetical protein